MLDISPEKIAELRRLCEEATPGPWVVQSGVYDTSPEASEFPHGPEVTASGSSIAFLNLYQERDARFIATAREALPTLLSIAEQPIPDEIEALIKRLRELTDWELPGGITLAIDMLRKWPRPTPGGNHD